MPKSKAAAQHDQRIIKKERERNAVRQRTESVAEIGREEKEQTATGQKVQANMLRNNLQAFLEQSARVADLANCMATRSFEASRQTPQEQSPRQASTPETRH
jgi:hypothetical protein